jgi:acetyl esterase/lipase
VTESNKIGGSVTRLQTMPELTRRDLALCLVGLAATKSWGSVSQPRSAQPPIGDVERAELIRFVDPELREFLRGLPKEGPLTAETIRQMRSSTGIVKTSIPPSLSADVVGRAIPGAKGAPDVQIFIVNGSPSHQLRPGLLYMHGGGYISGNTASSFPGFAGLKKIALDHNCTVISVDYRLAPETRFPGALEDNYSALKWLHSNSASLGVDPTRIAVMGESAGGGHAAMLAIAARDRGEVPVLFQLLIYPMLDDRTGSTRKVPPHIGAFIWTPEANRFGWSSLLGIPAGSRIVPEGSVPARVRDLRGLPPTYIGVGSLDLFVDDDIEFAKRLIDAGVPTEVHVSPGAYHGFFFLVPDAAVSRRFSDSYNAALTKAFSAESLTSEAERNADAGDIVAPGA